MVYNNNLGPLKKINLIILTYIQHTPQPLKFQLREQAHRNTEHYATCAYFLIFAAVHLSESRHIRSSCIAEFELLGKGTMSSISADDGDTNISLSSFFVL